MKYKFVDEEGCEECDLMWEVIRGRAMPLRYKGKKVIERRYGKGKGKKGKKGK